MKTKQLPPIRVAPQLYAAIERAAQDKTDGNISEMVRRVLMIIFLPDTAQAIELDTGSVWSKIEEEAAHE